LVKKRSDIFTKAKRSQMMSRIRSRGNKDTELALAKLFRQNQITGWRRQVQIVAAVYDRRRLSGAHRAPLQSRKFSVRPDFVFKRARLAVFVDGCFWHGCPRHSTKPKNNRTFWRNKFARNKARDVLVTRTLRRANWWVVRIWECSLKKNPLNCLRRIRRRL
jgi:DNA mismatch endonuclease (patch repair protein)